LDRETTLMHRTRAFGAWTRPALPLVVVSVLLCLGAANVVGARHVA
jgi:hypothetical protein